MTQTDDVWTIERVLNWTRSFFERKQLDSPRLSAELILAHVLGCARIKLYTDYQRSLSAKELSELRELIKRAGDEEPIAYLTGKAHFFNLEFEVSRDVLIPRPDTETLVEQVMTIIRNTPGFEAPRVLDLCCGSGVIAIAIAHHVKAAQVVGADLSDAALAIATKNIARHALSDRVTLLSGDLYAALASYVDAAPFDLIVANPPYIATGQLETLPRGVRDYEPRLALDGGPDGLTPHRRILAGAAERLRPGGRVLLEIAFDQQQAALEMIAGYDELTGARIVRDYAGHPRVLLAARKDAR